MGGRSEVLTNAIRELVIANRILAREGVVDALGHVSVRHPERPDRFLLSCSRSPELVTDDDILEFDLDCNPVDQSGRDLFAERWIHSSVYKARPEVNAVCHNHAAELIPFAATATPIRPVWVMGAAIGVEVPIWDIRDDFPDEDGLLIVNAAHAAAMTKRLGQCRCCLLACHGAVIAEATLKRAVLVSISLMTNAELQMRSRLLTMTQDGRDPRHLRSGEVTKMAELMFNPKALGRLWEYWVKRAGFKPD
ncbi:MAG TPA: class II aldolase/adducin family protein [Stellaceae bacterium]|nr:class II aldolase/adducin family protein [Stellaceae bacterium]